MKTHFPSFFIILTQKMARCNVLSNSSQESHALSAAITAAAAGIVAAAAGIVAAAAGTAATTAATAATAAGTAIAAGATVPSAAAGPAAANKQDQDENSPAVKAIVAVVAHNRFLLFQFFHSHTIAGTTRR